MSAKASKKYDLTQGPIFRTLLSFGAPIIVSNLIQYLYNVVDSMMLGNFVGTDAMGAVTAAGNCCGLLFSLAGGLAVGFSVIVGTNFGAKNKEDTIRAIRAAECLSLIAGVFFTILGFSCTDLLIRATQVQPQHQDFARVYMRILLGCSVVSMFNNMHVNLLRTLGDSRSPVVVLVASAFINVALNYLFLKVFAIGVAGVAIATIVSQLVSAILSLYFLLKHYPDYNFLTVNIAKGGEKIWLQELKMGIPMAFQQSMIMIGAVIVMTKVNAMDVTNEYAVGNNINNISSNVINTFGSVISGFVAQNYGAREPERIQKSIWYTLGVSLLLSALLAACLLFFSRTIVGWFVSDEEWSEELYESVRLFLNINIPFYLIWVPVPILRCAIQSFKNSILPFLSCLVELPMRCITAWVLGEYFGFAGLSLATPCSLVAAFLFLIVAFFIEWRKKIVPMKREKLLLKEKKI